MGIDQRLYPGDMVTFGTHTLTGKPEEWVVLMTNTKEKTALIACTESVAQIPYINTTTTDAKEPVPWAKSFPRRWLNNRYLSHFSSQEYDAIQLTIMPEKNEDGESVMDFIFILSEGEASLFFSNDESRVLLCNHEYNMGERNEWRNSCAWWLRAQSARDSETESMKVPVCSDHGELGGTAWINSPDIGVRPCMWVQTCALTKVTEPGLEDLNVRMLEKSRDRLSVFRDGREQVMDVLAEFVDDDLNRSFAILQDRTTDRPVIAMTRVDFFLKTKLLEKYEPLIGVLERKPYHSVMDMFQRRRDEETVARWMNQEAWKPTPGYYQPEIDDSGDCLIRMGHSDQNPDQEDRPLYWRVIKRNSNKILCICEEGIIMDSLVRESYFDCEEPDYSWESSHARSWMNSDEFFGSVFAEDEANRIMCCRTVEETHLTPPLHDYVFLLSNAEVSVFMPTEEERIIRNTPSQEDLDYGIDSGGANDWWLRTCGRKADSFCFVNASGKIDRDGKWGNEETCAIRPAILVQLTNIPVPYRKTNET